MRRFFSASFIFILCFTDCHLLHLCCNLIHLIMKIIFTGSCLSAPLRSYLEAAGQEEEEKIRNTITKETRKEQYKVSVNTSSFEIITYRQKFPSLFSSTSSTSSAVQPSSHSSVTPRFSLLADLSRKLFASFAIN